MWKCRVWKRMHSTFLHSTFPHFLTPCCPLLVIQGSNSSPASRCAFLQEMETALPVQESRFIVRVLRQHGLESRQRSGKIALLPAFECLIETKQRLRLESAAGFRFGIEDLIDIHRFDL